MKRLLVKAGAIAAIGLFAAAPLADHAHAADTTRTARLGQPPVGGAGYVPLPPARLLETRPGLTTVDGQSQGGGPLGPGATLDLTVTGRGGVPASGVGAVVLNVTAANQTTNTFLTVFPKGVTRPLASNLNPNPGIVEPNLVIAKVGDNGQVSIFNNAGSVDVIADVEGWYPSPLGASYNPLVPARIAETRPGYSTVDGNSNGIGILGEGQTMDLTVVGRGGVPLANVAAVAVNITAIDQTKRTFLTAFPTGSPRPTASNLNPNPLVPAPNLAIVKVGAGGKISIFNNSGSVNVIVDVQGWFPVGPTYAPLDPARVLETRPGFTTIDGQSQGTGPIGPDSTIHFKVTGRGGVPPSGVAAVVLDVTATNQTSNSYLTVFPNGTTQPTTSNLNPFPGLTAPNLVIAKIGPDGEVAVYNHTGSVDVIADVYGWFPSDVTATNDSATVSEDSAATPIPVLANDIDSFGGPITIASATQPTNGTVVLTGGVAGARTGLTYQPNANFCATAPTVDTFSYTLNGGASATVAMSVTCVNDAPSFAKGANQTVAEDSGPASVAGWATAISPGPANESAQSVNFVVSNDNNALFSTQPAVAANGTLTFTPAANANGVATVTVAAHDNGGVLDGGSDTSPAQTFTITVTAVDDAPVLDLDTTTVGSNTTATFVEVPAHDSSAAVALAPNTGITDVDNATMSSATVTLTNRPDGAAESLTTSGVVPSGITVSAYNSATGVLQLTGVDTIAHYTQVLAGVRYNDTTVGPNLTSRTITFTVNDGSLNSNVANAVVTISSLDLPPVVDLNGVGAGNDSAATYVEDAAPVAIAPSATVTDPDSATLASATVTLTNRPDGALESLAANVGGTSIAATAYDSSTGVLQLSGADTAAHYQQVLRTVTYATSSQNPSATPRSITVVVSDGIVSSVVHTSTVTVTPVNDPPVVTASGGSLSYTENQAATAIDAGLTLTDPESDNIQSATVSVTANFSSAQDVLGFVNQNGITGSYNSGTGVLSLSGSTTLANYQTALRSVTYQNTSDNPSTASRTISFSVVDTGTPNATSNTATRTVTVASVNDAPVNTVPGAQTVNEDTDLVFAGTISVADVDAGAGTVQVTVSALHGTIAPATGSGATVTGSGTSSSQISGTLAQVNAALNGLTYRATSNFNSTRGVETITVLTSDLGNTGSGGALTDSDTIGVTVTAVNDPPTAAPQTFGPNAVQADMKITGLTGLLSGAADPDSADGSYVSHLSVGTVSATSPAGGTVTVTNAATGTFDFDPPPGATGNVTFTYTVCDDGNPLPSMCSAPATATVNIAGPVIWFVDPSVSVTGIGTLSSPFKTLAEAVTAVGASTNQRIFLASGTYPTGVALNSGGWLVGQQVTGASFDAVMGITPPAGTVARPTIATGTATLQSTVTLNTNATVQGIAVNSGAADAMNDPAAAITGVSVSQTTLTTTTGTPLLLSDVTGSGLTFANVSKNGAGTGISLTTVNANTTISAGTIQNTTVNGVFIDGGSGDVADGASLSAISSGRAIVVQNKAVTANVAFSGSTGSLGSPLGGTGILLDNNDQGGGTPGAVSFTGTVNLSTGANPAFTATNGGTVTATSATSTLATTTATALNVSNTNIGAAGLAFRSISSTGGANAGIVLSATGNAGGLTVTGVGTTAASGGTISGKSVDAVMLNSTTGVSLSNMVVQNNSINGIAGMSVNGFSLIGSTVTNNGTSTATDSGVKLVDVSGAVSLSGTSVTNSQAHNVAIGATASSTAAITSLNVANSTFSGSVGGMGFIVQLDHTASLATGSFTNDTFSGNASMGLDLVADDSAAIGNSVGSPPTGAVSVNGSTFTNNGGLGVSFATGGGSGTSNMYVRFTGNTLTGTNSTAINVVSGAAATGGTQKVLIDNNVIGSAGTTGSGSAIGEGIVVTQQGNVTLTATVTNNVLRQIPSGRGIDVQALGPSAGGQTASNYPINLTITGNDVNPQDTSGIPAYAIYVGVDDQGSPTLVHAAIHGNTVPSTSACDSVCNGAQGMIEYEVVTPPSTGTLFNFSTSGADVSSEIANTNTGVAGKTTSPDTGLTLVGVAPSTVS